MRSRVLLLVDDAVLAGSSWQIRNERGKGSVAQAATTRDSYSRPSTHAKGVVFACKSIAREVSVTWRWPGTGECHERATKRPEIAIIVQMRRIIRDVQGRAQTDEPMRGDQAPRQLVFGAAVT